MSEWFHVGQKVVCVPWGGSRLSLRKTPRGANMPIVGKIYTIRTVNDYGDVILLRLSELDNSHLPYAVEPGFNTSGFRPLRKRTTDISCLTRLLNPTNVKENA